MDSETAMKRVVAEVANALSNYADQRGWKPNDYWIYYNINAEWDVVHLIFVSRQISESQEDSYYHEVWQFLIRHFQVKQDPAILRYFNLLVRSKSRVDKGGLYGIGPAFEEYRTITPSSRPRVESESGT
jgi:hypothetical protein